MKSVIINLKYLIFRSASASEWGSLEEGGGVEDGKSRAAASVLSASATLKPAPTEAQTVFLIFLFFFGGGEVAPFQVHLWAISSRPGAHIQFDFCASRFVFSIGLRHLSPISKLHPQPSALAPERLRALVIRCEACLTLTDKPALTMPVPAAW